MSLKNVLVGALAVGIAFASLDLGATAASAATMKMPATHHHHHFTCKAGYQAVKVKVDGKWVWHCHRIHHKHRGHHDKVMPKMTPKVAPQGTAPSK